MKKLYLSSCKLTNFCNYDLKLNNIIAIDISFNHFNIESIKLILNQLNSCKLEILNLNFCIDINSTSLSLGTLILEFFENGTCEQFKFISLQGCNLNDADIYKIVENLSNTKNLELLDLSLNHNLTAVSIQYIINKISYIKKLYLKQCKNIVDLYRFKNLHITTKTDNTNIIQHISLTIDNNFNDNYDSIEEKEKIIQQFWKMLHGDKAKMKILGNNIDLYV